MFSKTNASLRSQIFALLLFFPFSTFAAYDINLAGQVLDASNAPIPGVEVQLKDSDLKAVSDSNGQWTLVHSVELYNNPASIQEGMRRKSLSTTSSIYNVMGRQLEDSHLAQGVYILRESVEPLLQHSQYLAKFAGEMDSLIVSYQGSVVGRIAVADPLQADPLRMTLVTVSPLVSPAEAQGTASAYTTLVGQQVQVNFQYDELLWGPTWLSVGNTKTAATGKTFSVLLSNATDSVTLALVSRKQTIAWGSLDAIPYGSPDFKVNATVESQLAVSVKSNTPAVCTVSDSWVHLVAVGTCELVASQAGNDFYAAASDVTQSFVVNPREITVFVEDKSKVYGTDDPALTYRAPGLLPGDVPNVVLQRETGESANSYVIDGSFLHPNYHATIVKGIFRITPVPLHIKSANLGTQASLPLPDYSWFTTKIPAAGVLIAHSYEVEPALPADVTVSYKSTTPSVCTYDQSSAKLTLLDSGACTIQAITTPANYESPSQTFLVNQFRDARDQQVYGAVQIGNQIWMSRNLNYSRQETLGYCYQNLEDYKFDSTWHRDTPYCNPYGRSYFWNEAMNVDTVYLTNNAVGVATNLTTGAVFSATGNNQGLCPTGWHVPSNTEFGSLFSTVQKDYGVASGLESPYLKVTGINYASLWNQVDQNDPYGFSLLPSGSPDIPHMQFSGFGDHAYLWTASGTSGSNSFDVYFFGTKARFQNFITTSKVSYTNVESSIRCIQD